MTTTPTVRYAGDDWKGSNAFLFTYSAPGGTPINLTGYAPSGILFGNIGQTQLTVGNGRAALTNATAGQFTLSVEAAVTGALIPQAAAAPSFNNRLQVMLTDPTGDLITLAVLPLLVLAPGTVYP